MGYSTTITLLYGVRTTRDVEEKELQDRCLPELCNYYAGNCCSGEMDYFVALNRTVQTFDDDCQYSLALDMSLFERPTPEEVQMLEAVPDQVPGSEGWHLLSCYG